MKISRKAILSRSPSLKELNRGETPFFSWQSISLSFSISHLPGHPAVFHSSSSSAVGFCCETIWRGCFSSSINPSFFFVLGPHLLSVYVPRVCSPYVGRLNVYPCGGGVTVKVSTLLSVNVTVCVAVSHRKFPSL